MKPTKTTNRIHFTDLEDRRFEDLSLQLVYRLTDWEFLHPDGRSGKDDGVDIRGEEIQETGNNKEWFIQCKRYKKAASSILKKAVDEALSKSISVPDVFLLIVACDISLQSRLTFEKYSKNKGIKDPILWQASTIETKLYSDYPDLLFTFFGISFNKKTESSETKIKKNLAMKRKLRKIFKGAHLGHEVIIHSIKDDSYPEVGEVQNNEISSWFKLEYNGFYVNGIEFVIDIEYVILEKETSLWQAKWARFNPSKEGLKLIDYKDDSGKNNYTYIFKNIINLNKYSVYKSFRIVRIPFSSIIEVDESSDGIYLGPHLYCKFEHNGTPYQERINQLIEGAYLETKNEIEFHHR